MFSYKWQIISPQKIDRYFTFRVHAGRYPIGYARLSFEDNHVCLGDIYIRNFRDSDIGLWRSLVNPIYFTNFRSKGIGSALLIEIISFCKQNGAHRIYGKAVGDIPRLKKWYESFGFTVDERNNIELLLG